MTIAVILCASITALAFVYVFYPARQLAMSVDKTRLSFLYERKQTIYENLRDLNFEYKAGKYPEADYQSMRNSLEVEAAATLAEIEKLERTNQA